MIELYSTNVATTTGMTIAWNNKSVQTNTTATLAADNETILLNAPGVYEISVNAYGSTDAAGAFGLQLNGNGAAITRAAASQSTGATTLNGSVAFNTLLRVVSGASTQTASVTLTYTGGDGDITLVDIVVKRVA